MNRHSIVLAAGVCLAAASLAQALDVIRTSGDRASLRGDISAMSPIEVELKTGATVRKIPVNEIVSISYDREPPLLTSARTALLGGQYENALASLQKVTLDGETRLEIRQDVEYYRALCRAELALGGSGEIVDAGKQMAALVNTHKGSYHWLRANEIVGDLLVANGQYDMAEAYYNLVRDKAPWADYKMRAGVAAGRARLAQGKVAEALTSFESVINTDDTSDLAQSQRLAATVGKARCLAANKQYPEACRILEDVIKKTDPEQVELNARAYNALGNALKDSGRPKDALLAFLHVDTLYFAVPETHAEALANLADLWEKEDQPARAARARRILEERYKNSPWAK